MATTAHPAAAASKSELDRFAVVPHNALVLWHLFSLDAPTVAVLWTWFIARDNHIALPLSANLAMGLAVWLLYAADRLLDSRFDPRANPEQIASLEPRHIFHRCHQRGFRLGICLSSAGLAALVPGLAIQSLRLYLILGAMLLAYFVLIHAGAFSARESTRRLPKEIAVGVFFSAAVFIPTVAREPSLRMVLLPDALLFAAVCSLNCLFIYAWEHACTEPGAHLLTRLALRHLPRFAVVAALSGIALVVSNHQRPMSIPAACACAAVLLLLLHRNRHRLRATTLRAAADLCLLTPLLFLPLLPH